MINIYPCIYGMKQQAPQSMCKEEYPTILLEIKTTEDMFTNFHYIEIRRDVTFDEDAAFTKSRKTHANEFHEEE